MRHAVPGRPVLRVAVILLQVSETAIQIVRRREWRKGAAVLLNAVLFAVGVYFEMRPRDRRDVFSAAGVAVVAVMNSAALTVPAVGLVARLVVRLRRIALFANAMLLPVAAVIVVLEGLSDWRHLALHFGALVMPPAVTLAALRREAMAGAEARTA